MRFVPLHVYSVYSFLKSGLTIEKIIDSVNKNGYFGAAISDMGVMYGVPEFVNTMEKAKKPYIIGMEISLEENTYCLYVINEEGYLNLSMISSCIQNETFDKNILLNHNKGLVAILDTSHGKIKEQFEAVLDDEEVKARYLNELSKMFETFYVGIEFKQRDEMTYVKRLRAFLKEHSYQTVAFPHIKYQEKKDAIILDIAEAIDKGEKIEHKEKEGNQFFMSLNDYQKIYTAEELENTCKIVEMSSFTFSRKRGEMISFNEKNSDTYIKTLCYTALNDKGLGDKEEYKNRLDYELSVISSMGYSDYFLLVQDYVSWAKNNDILVSPRGSASGSLVTYLLGITPLDPIEYELQFERFLNPSRKTMPDIDVDFMSSRRSEVIDYCREKYGKDRVAVIITFSTIKSKQSIRDIGKVYDYPTRFNDYIDKLCKSLGDTDYSLRDSYRKVPEFRELVKSDKFYLEIVTLASKIEGLIRQSSIHAAGVVMNNFPIPNALPVTYDLSDNLISQYEGAYLEDQGFLKMDILGINHLSVVARCVELINENHPEAKIDKLNIPYDDEKTYEIIRSLQTMSIFQLESAGMKNAIKVLKPTNFKDVAVLIALFRPGPMNEIISYAKRKEGKEAIPHMSEAQNKILGETYGIIVYQEQVNALAVAMAGMTLTDADNFRRAVSKKKIEIISSMKDAFINGSIKNGYSKEEAIDYYERIERFADYAFNKSHAFVYALLSCQMAYLKAYYPLEFYTAVLQISSSSSDSKFSEYVKEMNKRGINIVPPNINVSDITFKIDDGNIVFPLTSISGVSVLNGERIINERNNRPFEDFFDFVARVYKYKFSDVVFNNLIDSGALDALYPSRKSMRASLKAASQYADFISDDNGQISFEFALEKPAMVLEVDDPIENLEKEYDVIGIMLSDNPLKYMKEIYERDGVYNIEQALEMEVNKDISVVGIIRGKKVITIKNGANKGAPMAYVTLFDETSEMEATFLSSIYKDYSRKIVTNSIVLITGHFELYKGNKSFIAKSIEPLGVNNDG